MQPDAQPHPHPGSPAAPRPRPHVPLLVLLGSLLLTGATTYQVNRSARAADRMRHEGEVNAAIADIRDRIAQRREAYVAILHGAAGMFSVNRRLELPEFRRYVRRLNLEKAYPGVLGIGVALRAGPQDLDTVLKRMAESGQPDFKVWPESPPREVYYPIVYLEPLDARNRAAMGFDMYFDPARREAMERACGEGGAAASAKVELKQEVGPAGSKQAGFLIYYPVYRTSDGDAPATAEQRREQIAAFVYSPFRADDFLGGVFEGRAESLLGFDLYDGTEVAPQHLLSTPRPPSPGDAPGRPVTVDMAGRTWTIVFRPQELPGPRGLSRAALAVASAGAAISVLLFALTRAQAVARHTAERGAEEIRDSAQALKRREEQFQLVTDALPVLVSYVDSEQRYRFNNRAHETFFGRPRADLPGMHLRDAVGEKQYQRVRPYVERALAGEQVAFDVDTSTPQGQRRYDHVVYVPDADPDGTVRGFVALSADITERKLAEQERVRLLAAEQEARAEAQSANRAKDEFLATLSHELRTPLNAILGWSQLMKMGALPPEEITQGLETIERNAKAQAQLVEDLLDLSRIISGKLRLEVRPVDLPAVIEGALDSVRPAAEAKGIIVVPVLDSHAHTVPGDANRLQQVAWNLLSNAIKFTPRGGRVDVWLRGTATDVELTVSDTGAGIKPDFLPHVFDRLRQADASITRRHGGLGLGLAIVRHLVELHGGTVSAESPGEGRGATFTVRLPLGGSWRDPASRPTGARHGGHEPATTVQPERRLEGVRVLVVDDEPDAREVLQVGLGIWGARVTTAASAAEAMLALKGDVPDVLLSDIGMPVEDGYSLIRRVRQLPEAQGGKVLAVALTAFARTDDRARALEAGYHAHVAKPVEPSKLAAIVADLLGRDALVPSSGTSMRDERAIDLDTRT